MEKEDCFAYVNRRGHKGCRALNVMQCKEKECRFYKNKNEISQKYIEFCIKNYSKFKDCLK